MGCLSLPFKLLGSLAVLLALGVGWLYRDRLSTEVGRLLNHGRSSDSAVAIGRPGAHALGSAKSKVDSLNGWRADSVVLTPSEVASLIGAGLNASLRRQLDSLQVELQDGEIAINAKLATARLPRELTGPLALALREREPVQAAGPIAVVRPGRAEWKVRSFRIRDFPVPRDVVPKLLAKAFGDTTQSGIPVRIPAGIREIRVRPSGATLLGAPRP
jgi:hypothetical protein